MMVDQAGAPDLQQQPHQALDVLRLAVDRRGVAQGPAQNAPLDIRVLGVAEAEVRVDDEVALLQQQPCRMAPREQLSALDVRPRRHAEIAHARLQYPDRALGGLKLRVRDPVDACDGVSMVLDVGGDEHEITEREAQLRGHVALDPGWFVHALSLPERRCSTWIA